MEEGVRFCLCGNRESRRTSKGKSRSDKTSRAFSSTRSPSANVSQTYKNLVRKENEKMKKAMEDMQEEFRVRKE